MLGFLKTALVTLALIAGAATAQASMGGPDITREEFVQRLDALSFPWALAAKVLVDKSLTQFERFEDLKALQEQVGDPLPYDVFTATAYDATGFFSVDVREYPSIEVRDFEVTCSLQRLTGLERTKDTNSFFYYAPKGLRVYRVTRYVPLDGPQDEIPLLSDMSEESADCAAH